MAVPGAGVAVGVGASTGEPSARCRGTNPTSPVVKTRSRNIQPVRLFWDGTRINIQSPASVMPKISTGTSLPTEPSTSVSVPGAPRRRAGSKTNICPVSGAIAPAGRSGIGNGVAVGVAVCVGVAVGVPVLVGVGVKEGVGVAVTLGVAVGVTVGVQVGVGVNVFSGVLVGTSTSLRSPPTLPVMASVLVMSDASANGGVGDGVGVTVGVGRGGDGVTRSVSS